MSSSENDTEDGSGTILGVVLVFAIFTLTSLVFAAGSALFASQRAAHAADAAAIGAATIVLGFAVGDPCGVAAEISARMAVVLDRCSVDGGDVLVEAHASVKGVGFPARARAGTPDIDTAN